MDSSCLRKGLGSSKTTKNILCFWPLHQDFAVPPLRGVKEDQNLHALATWDFLSPRGHVPSILQTTGAQMASTEPQHLPGGGETFPLQPRGLVWRWLLILQDGWQLLGRGQLDEVTHKHGPRWNALVCRNLSYPTLCSAPCSPGRHWGVTNLWNTQVTSSWMGMDSFLWVTRWFDFI